MFRPPTMRNPLRRVSLALGITNKPSPSPVQASIIGEALTQFLSESKARYLQDVRADPSKGTEWTVSMGNEAGGLYSTGYTL